ncbi:MAG TPA: Gfo/Idh/MocA family oxidoreductase [Gemmataceae bacterium]|nr:Gfo/Idh/MocA family oxidoreductase [Gemmataceae bacterium]
MPSILRVGLVGAGANTRARHIPGLRAIPDVEIVAVCNRRPESTAAVAREYGIPRTFETWQALVADPDIDAVVIGTWPYLHCPITLAALEAGKHVLTEARMSMNAAEAHRMLAAARRHPHLVTQIVPSPYGLKGHDVMRELIASGFLGELREVHVVGLSASLADPAAPLSWRQDVNLSGFNMLSLGIVHETLLRWVPPPVRVLAQVHAFIPRRIDPTSGVLRPVGTPDSVQVLAVLENGARAVYHFSGVTPFGQEMGIWLYGSEGVLYYDLATDRIRGASKRRGAVPGRADALEEIPIPPEKARSWRVEADFVDAIRGGEPPQLTDFATGVAYMEFTEAVARSARRGEAVELPLEEFIGEEADEFEREG